MSIKKELFSGSLWIAAGKYSALIVQIAVMAVLARLIPPSLFGIIAIAIIVIDFLGLIVDFGIGPAVIVNRDLTKEDVNSIFSFTIYAGVFFAFLLLSLSPLIGEFYCESQLTSVCRVLSVSLLFNSWNMVPNALILQSKNFKFIAKRTILLQLISGVISIFAAYKGAGIYSLTIAPILSAIGSFVFNVRKINVSFEFHIKLSSLQKILSFSTFQFLFNLNNYIFRNLDKLLIGKTMTMAELGCYDVSYKLMKMPLTYASHVVTPVLLPTLSVFHNELDLLSEKYNKLLKLLGIVSFPLGVFCYYASNDIISIIYGDKWLNAIPVFQILALSVPIQMLLTTIGSIFQAACDTKWLFITGVISSLLTIVGFIIAIQCFKTIEAVAWSFVITLFLGAFVSYYCLYKITLRSSLKLLLNSLLVPFIIGLISFVALWLTTKTFTYENHIWGVILKLGQICIIFFVVVQITHTINIVNWARLMLKKHMSRL